MTVSEPLRDDDVVHDAFALVPCPACDGLRTIVRERPDGVVVRRRCRECKGSRTGTVPQGNPVGERYGLGLDYCAGLYPCCRGARVV